MTTAETPLQSARRRLRAAEARVERQRQVVARLSGSRHCTRLATELLADLERLVRIHGDEVRRLQREEEGDPAP
jgi:hypothetical protein